MTYSLSIIRQDNSSKKNFEVVNDIKTWDDVLDYLKHKLDQWTIKVHIYKWSSNNRCLGEKCVTMGNLWFICFSETDKVLI